jgi:hypothetical protein
VRGQGARGEGQGGLDGHHLRVHGQRRVAVVALALRLDRRQCTRVLRNTLRLGFALRVRPQALLELGNGGAIEGRTSDIARLQSAAVKAWAVGVEALPNNLASADNYRAVAVEERRQLGLCEAEGEIGIVARRHFDSPIVGILVLAGIVCLNTKELNKLQGLRLSDWMQGMELRSAFLDVADLLLGQSEVRLKSKLKSRIESLVRFARRPRGHEFLPYKFPFQRQPRHFWYYCPPLYKTPCQRLLGCCLVFIDSIYLSTGHIFVLDPLPDIR